MAADRVITCTNQNGDFVEFREDGFFPFLLMSVEGVYDNANNVYLMDDAVTDGAVFQGGKRSARNIVINCMDQNKSKQAMSDEGDVMITSAIIHGKTLEILEAYTAQRYTAGNDFINHRALLDKVFVPNEMGTLSFSESGEEKVINYYVESISSSGTHTKRVHSISLICPDPYFYKPEEERIVLGELVPKFKFIHEFTADGEEFGAFTATYVSIENDSAGEQTGITVAISGKGDIINPGITSLETGKSMKLGTAGDPFTLQAGDLLLLTTDVGNKHVYLTHGGTTTEVNYLLTDDSEFIQLVRGENNIFFNCTEGGDMAKVEISFRQKYARA